MSRDYIPRNMDKFYQFANHFIEYVGEHSGEWKVISTELQNEMLNQFNAFHDALNMSIKNQTPANNIRRNEARTVLEKSIRGMVNQFLRFPPITDADRKEIGIPIRDTIRTQRTTVHETVEFIFETRGTNNLIIRFWQTGSDSKARPKGFSGAVIIWALSEEEPATNDDYTKHTLATRTPHTIEFDNRDSGKRVWVKICWQNARGIVGRWCEAKSAVVP